MGPEIGHSALALSLSIAIIQATIPLYGARRRDADAMAFAEHAALGQFLFVSLSFGCLANESARNLALAPLKIARAPL